MKQWIELLLRVSCCIYFVLLILKAPPPQKKTQKRTNKQKAPKYHQLCFKYVYVSLEIKHTLLNTTCAIKLNNMTFLSALHPTN